MFNSIAIKLSPLIFPFLGFKGVFVFKHLDARPAFVKNRPKWPKRTRSDALALMLSFTYRSSSVGKIAINTSHCSELFISERLLREDAIQKANGTAMREMVN